MEQFPAQASRVRRRAVDILQLREDLMEFFAGAGPARVIAASQLVVAGVQ